MGFVHHSDRRAPIALAVVGGYLGALGLAFIGLAIGRVFRRG